MSTILPTPRPRSRAALFAAAVAVALALVTVTALLAPSSGRAVDNGAQPLERVAAEDAAATVSLRPAGKVDDRARGLRWKGLKDSDECPGAYAVQHTRDDGAAGVRNNACSHGPDPAPKGVDVMDKPTVAELQAGTTASSTGAVPCYGDGVSGRRIQAIYTVASDRTNRYPSVLPLIRTYAANADAAFNASAARGGQVRHLRWVTTPDCQLDVAQVVLSPTGDDSMGNTRTELQSLGYNRTDRKYIIWGDATVYCGISYTAGDARADNSNPANNGPTYSRVDSGCWGQGNSVEAHEITHMLGGVQLTAPHSNGAWHCTDEYDRMCYNDGSGATLSYVCGSSWEAQLDCNGDDYFNVKPVAGSWLESHWNIANSLFLESAEPSGATSPSPTSTSSSSPSPTATTTSDPSPTSSPTTSPTVTTSTTTFSGSINRKSAERSFTLAAGAGPLTSSLSYSKLSNMTLTVTKEDGVVLASGSGPSVLKVLAQTPSPQNYRLIVSGNGNSSFTLSVTYAS